MSFDYTAFPHPVRASLAESHRTVWSRLAEAGTWWTGAQRIAIAQVTREAFARRNDPPWLRQDEESRVAGLPEAAVRAAKRIALDAKRLDAQQVQEMVAALGDAPYVELTSLVVCVVAIDAFAAALGVPPEPLPEPLAGKPSRVRPAEVGDDGAFLPMTVPWQGPNVARALSLVPEGNASFFQLVASMYAFQDFAELVWKDRPLPRPQVELIAARVSSVNECFY